ncbi:TnsA endonuclease N-terminal domain-containing protein [Anabaena subtropica]|uniref:DDE-type integrase/transposase/recombinase n=1 Tax=Anabaena subtropica FACHB-260 TaxID=2692884 RepID=A0ABR8CRH5_9NOST|nr:TnsA endonuclease N-terminal domain-containing protein [Anabaena subtropica]MBD2345544.1 DDE-type integrase/transposase/recombinase [Anabaena subtropica FACHB-260]
MLSKAEFDAWCCHLNVSQQTQNLIEKIRSSEPSRRVGGGRKNVSGRYPSRKMGVTIQFESHRVELPTIYEFEHDEEVLEFYDQPLPIKLDYQGKNGRNLGVLHTPDFFVIRSNCAGWEECKTEEELKKLAQKNPNRYFCDSEGRWRTPPGENYAQQLGLYYHLRVDTQINWVIQRNTIFLEDYFRAESLQVETAIKAEVQHLVSASPGISLADLLNNGTKASADDVYALIATEQLYVDLSVAPLAEPERVCVFADEQTATAYGLMLHTTSSTPISFSAINLSPGTLISWDGKGLNIIHVGDTEVTLQDELEQLIQLKKTLFLNLVQQGKIKSLQKVEIPDIKAESWEQFYQASPEDQIEALRRYKAIEPYLNENPPENETVSERTIRHWKSKYLAAQQQYGCGYIGLLSHRSAKGNRTRKLPEETLVLMEKFILEDYETLKQKKMWEVYGALVRVCEQQFVIAPSYKAFTKEIKKRSGYEQIKKRQGRRAAYKHETFYWELSRTTPRHGDRPFEIAHIDHTELDVELVCSRTGRSLGRPWATFLIDAYSRRFLAVYLTFDSPSYRSCLMALRLCVQRHNRLPQIILVDNGAEFHSVYFETLLATFECTKKNRPPAKGRFGSVCERLFGTSNTQFVYNLLGNTQITRNVRQVTKSVNPKNQAIWTLGLLYEYLCAWAYEIYDTDEHPALFQSPRDAFAAGIAISGSRLHRIIPYDENFQILTLPTTSQAKAKVQCGNGVKINSIYYWSNIFRDPQIENAYVQVRYDPFDIGIAYAFVRGQWVQCISQYYAEFQGRSEKELKLASSELRKRYSNHARQSKVSAKNLAEFLASVEAQETLLEQRSYDAEAKEVFRVIEGGKANFSSNEQPKVIPIPSRDINNLVAEDEVNAPEKLVVYEEF